MTPIITDHALIRWLERVHGIDMESFRGELAERVRTHVAARAAGAQIDGHWYVFAGAKLVTVQPDRPDAAQYRRHQREIVNGTDAPRQPMPWQAKKRKRRK